MTKVYFVRHCESEGNTKRAFQGTSDCDITKRGKKQLEFLKNRFAEIHLDIIYTSPLTRAKETAYAIKGDRDIPVTEDSGFIEINFGKAEGQSFFGFFKDNPEMAEIWNNSPQDFVIDGGESIKDAYDRVWHAVLRVAGENKGKSIAIASHGGVARCVACMAIFGKKENLKDTKWCENTGVTLINFDDDFNAVAEYVNDCSHLPDELLPKLSRIVEVIGN